MAVDRVLLAAPRGFCAGVEMAIKALAWMVRAFEPPVYCYHEIVHNQLVVDRFERPRAWCSSTTSPRCPPGRPIMLSAHGSAPEVVAAARASGGYVVDAVCPLVTKVHHEVKVRAGKGYRIVYVGHEGHEEAVGTMAVAPDADPPGRVGRRGRRARPTFDEPVALLAQTTLSHRDWAGVARRRPATASPTCGRPGRSDLCFATTNRQSALMAMAPRCDADRRDRLGQLVQHPGAREAGRRGRLPRGCYRVNARRRAARRPARHGRRHRRRVGARGARRRGDRPPRARATASRRCASPTRTSTSRRRATSATCRPRSRSPPRRSLGGCARRPGPASTTARSRPATCSRRSAPEGALSVV